MAVFFLIWDRYGIIPKVMFQETYHSSNSGALNALLTRKFRLAALGEISKKLYFLILVDRNQKISG